MTMTNPTKIILEFLGEIGIEYQLQPLSGVTFLPGLKMSKGRLLIDPDQLLYPGDILHEAGHLACMPPEIRKDMSDDLPNSDLHAGGEMMAIGWSYAACIYLNLDSSVVFHEHGYKDGSESLLENFRESRYIGVPLLQWLGMSLDDRNAELLGLKPYPVMQKWLCTERPAG